jgi:hypothetical protein
MEQRFIQILATVILFFGCFCVGAADHYNWRDLANAGNTVIGVGAGILTGQKLATLALRPGDEGR